MITALASDVQHAWPCAGADPALSSARPLANEQGGRSQLGSTAGERLAVAKSIVRVGLLLDPRQQDAGLARQAARAEELPELLVRMARAMRAERPEAEGPQGSTVTRTILCWSLVAMADACRHEADVAAALVDLGAVNEACHVLSRWRCPGVQRCCLLALGGLAGASKAAARAVLEADGADRILCCMAGRQDDVLRALGCQALRHLAEGSQGKCLSMVSHID